MRGRALETTVLDSIATNIASRRPDIASSTSRWVIAPDCSTGLTAEVGLVAPADAGTEFLMGSATVDYGNFIPSVPPNSNPHPFTAVAASGKCRRPAGVTTGSLGSLQPDVGRITYGSGVCVGLPAALRAGRLLLDRSHLTRPIGTQLWTTSFLVYDDANPPHKACSTVLTTCRRTGRSSIR